MEVNRISLVKYFLFCFYSWFYSEGLSVKKTCEKTRWSRSCNLRNAQTGSLTSSSFSTFNFLSVLPSSSNVSCLKVAAMVVVVAVMAAVVVVATWGEKKEL